MFSSLRPWLMSSLLVLVMTPAFASTPEPTQNSDLIITNLTEKSPTSDILAPTDPSLDQQEIEITYDPKDFDGEAETSGNKKQLLEFLRTEMNTEHNDNVLYVPHAPASPEQLEKLANLNESEIQSFLGKKQKFLEKIAKVFTTLRLKPKHVNKILAEVNNKFYNSSRLVANSNSSGVSVMLSISGGLALPKKIIEKIQGRPLARFIPKSGGFSYLMGLGMSLSRTVKEDGRTHWVLDIFLDTEKLKHAFTGMIEVAGSGTFGVIYELREGEFGSQEFDTSYGGVAGVFRQGDHHFGWTASTGMSLPPGIGAFLVFTNHATRHYLVRLDFSKLAGHRLSATTAVILSWMERTGLKKSNTAPSCSSLLL